MRATSSLILLRKKTIENALRDFRLSGVHLTAEKKAQYLALEQKLSQLTTKFSENLLDATQAWFLTVSDESQLAGLPESTKELAKKNAQTRKVTGWVLGLDFPTYLASMKFLDNRDLRKQIYEAYSTRASELGAQKDWDNGPIMAEILSCRDKLAKLLDFKNYAEYSLAAKMAKQPELVMEFLNNLLSKAKPFAEKEMTELKAFALSLKGPSELAPWDVSYYAEKLRQEKYNFSEEETKPYFPIEKSVQRPLYFGESYLWLRDQGKKGSRNLASGCEVFMTSMMINMLIVAAFIRIFTHVPSNAKGPGWMNVA